MGKKFLSVEDLMKFVRINRPVIYRLIERGLPCYKFGRRRLFDRDELVEWVKSPKDEGSQKRPEIK